MSRDAINWPAFARRAYEAYRDYGEQENRTDTLPWYAISPVERERWECVARVVCDMQARSVLA